MLSAIRKTVKVVFYIILVALGVVLAVSNRARVELTLFPLPYAITLPLFIFAIAVFIAGILSGWAIARFRVMKIIRSHKVTGDRVLALENELAAVRSELLIK